MSDKDFIRLCEEVLEVPRLRNRYSSNSHGLLNLKEYEVFHLDEDRRPIVDRVVARGPCRTTPRLYLSDGSKKFSAFLHLYLDQKKLLRVSIAENLRTLGYNEQLQEAPAFIRDR